MDLFRRVAPKLAGVAISASLFIVVGKARVPNDQRSSQGTAALTGTLRNVADGAALRGATVTAISSDSGGVTVTSDDNGRFAFRGLPAGLYRLSAYKPGFLTGEFGARSPGRQATGVILRDGQQLDVDFRLARGAVITGTVFDTFGQPAPRRYISLLRRQMTETGRRLFATLTSSATFGIKGPVTDDLGQYRLYGIPPGEYLVVVDWQAPPGPSFMTTTVADVQLARQLIQNPTMPLPPPRSVNSTRASSSLTEQPVTLAPVYHPGTLMPENAALVRVVVGQELTDIDVRLLFARPTEIDASIAAFDGRPLTGVVAQLLSNDPDLGSRWTSSVVPVSADKIHFSGTPPGRYVIEARTRLDVPSSGSALFGAAEIDVDGRSFISTGVLLHSAGSVSGDVADEDGRPVAASARLGVKLTPAQPVAKSWRTPVTSAVQQAKFSLPTVSPGQYRVSLADADTAVGWRLVSARVGDRDVTDRPFELGPGESIANLTLVVSNRETELTGLVEDPRGQPAGSAYMVVVFPRDSTTWYWQARGIRATHLSESGRFAIRALNPGAYYVAVVNDLEPGEWFDPSVLEQLVPGALSVAVEAGKSTNQAIRIR